MFENFEIAREQDFHSFFARLSLDVHAFETECEMEVERNLSNLFSKIFLLQGDSFLT